MITRRSAIGVAVATLLALLFPLSAAQALPRTSTGAAPAVTVPSGPTPMLSPGVSGPCVHRGITFFCGGGIPAFGSAPLVTVLQFSFGNPGDLPVFGDWNGDGNRTAAVFRPATFTWYLSDTDNASDPPQQLSYGMPGDIPLSGDWNGTGHDTVGLYRPSNATFYLRDTNTSGVADVTIPLGNRGDVPLAGDFDLTGTTRIGVYRPSNATFYETHGSGPVTATPFGNPGDRPLAGSWGCSSTDTNPRWATMVFRPSNLTWYGWWESHGNNCLPVLFTYGDPTDLPLWK